MMSWKRGNDLTGAWNSTRLRSKCAKNVHEIERARRGRTCAGTATICEDVDVKCEVARARRFQKQIAGERDMPTVEPWHHPFHASHDPLKARLAYGLQLASQQCLNVSVEIVELSGGIQWQERTCPPAALMTALSRDLHRLGKAGGKSGQWSSLDSQFILELWSLNRMYNKPETRRTACTD